MLKQMLRSGDPIKFTDDELLQRKIENVLDDLEWTVKHLFLDLSPDANKRMVVDFINELVATENPRPNTKRAYITNLILLSRHFKHQKSFREFTRDDILAYLQTYKKSAAADPKEKWINTYNQKTALLAKFFKWLYFPDLPKNERKKAKPDVVKNLPTFMRKEKATVEAKDLWLAEEDRVFLKYCQDPRLCLYHTMADDTSGRPAELLALRFNDVKIKNNNGKIYGEVEIGRGGK
ncbi:MAG TPA: site-specific integrase, partial [Nitrososphaera sp.]|nr:site-specific integrase [Nitrososphaera sp.]